MNRLLETSILSVETMVAMVHGCKQFWERQNSANDKHTECWCMLIQAMKVEARPDDR
jgi:hypothetical protein